MELTGKIALVTGAAHRVGKSVALSLAKKGANIIVHYARSENLADQTVNEIKELGVNAEKIKADFQNLSDISLLCSTIEENYGKLHIVVNSASSFVKKPINSTSIEDWDKSQNINVRAPFFIIQNIAPLIKKSLSTKTGLIVNISDLSAIHPWNNFASHGISKAGMVHLTKIAAREYAPHIRVNCIIPGLILPPSNMTDTDDRWLEMQANIPLKKSGSINIVGNTVIYFAENEFVTGSIVVVDGGENLIGPKNH